MGVNVKIRIVDTDPEVYYYTSGMLNGLHGTIGTVNGTLNGLHGTIGTENGTQKGLHGTIRTENGWNALAAI
jgi:hypothetical protein